MQRITGSKLLAALAALFLVLVRPAAAEPLRSVVGTDVVHEVQTGETLFSLAHDHFLGLEHVTYVNGLPMQLEIPAGTVITLPERHVLPANPPKDGMVLNIPERGIFLFRHGQFVHFYPVAVGRIGFLTPRGSFHIIEKVKDPTWTPPAWADVHEPIGPGKTNPLGDRWIGTSATRVGIHGTQSPYSIGMAISHGCIRMYPDQVRALYEQVWVGMPLRIEYETAKLGRDPSTGNVYLATFPDLYHLQDPGVEALRKVRGAGLLSQVTAEEVRALASGNFRAVPLIGSDFQVTVNDVRVKMAVPPLARGKALWLPVDFLRTLGATVDATDPTRLALNRQNETMLLEVKKGRPPAIEPKESRGTLTTDAGGQTVRTIVIENGKPVATAWRWKGHTYVRADDFFGYYDMPYDWQVTQQRLTVKVAGAQVGDSLRVAP